MSPDSRTVETGSFHVLERSTATVLILTLLALGWTTVEAYLPGWAGDVPAETGVIVVVLLVVAAIVLVSVMALRQTGRGEGELSRLDRKA